MIFVYKVFVVYFIDVRPIGSCICLVNDLPGIGSMGTCGTGDLSGVAGNALPNSACAVQVNSNGQQMIITAGQAGSGIQSKIHQELAQAHQKYEKLKRVLQDKTVELGHALRRADAFEQEVKKLRSRIEELKAMLGAAQDEVGQIKELLLLKIF